MSQHMDAKLSNLIPTQLFNGIRSSFRRFLFLFLAFGPLPRHIAIIPDGNRRYGRRMNLQEGEAYGIGIFRVISVIKFCYEMGIPYVSFYGFSIDNFRRKPAEVEIIMKLIRERSQDLIQNIGIVHELGVRVEFLGNLDLLDEHTRETCMQAMAATAKNTRIVVLVLLAYSSTDEIVRGVQRSCEEKWEGETGGDVMISAEDLDRHMYLAAYPNPDILIRTSGETRLSNFLLWQSTACLLYSPRCLWPEISLRHMVWAVLQYQRNWLYLEKIRRNCVEKIKKKR